MSNEKTTAQPHETKKWARILRALAHEISRGRVVVDDAAERFNIMVVRDPDGPVPLLRIHAAWDGKQYGSDVCAVREDDNNAN